MSQKGDLFEDMDGNSATTITFTPSINHFITKNFFIGVGFEFKSEAQGTDESNAIGLGPQLGIVLGGPQSKAFPYIDFGIRYYKLNFDYGFTGVYQSSGSNISFGFGLIVPIKSHIGLIFEGGYHKLKIKDYDSDDSSSGKIMSIGVGIAGLLFQNAN